MATPKWPWPSPYEIGAGIGQAAGSVPYLLGQLASLPQRQADWAVKAGEKIPPMIGQGIAALSAGYKGIPDEPPPPPAPPAAKPAPPKINPVPAAAAGGTDVLQKSGPAEGRSIEEQLGPALDYPMNALPPADEPPKSPGMVSVTLPDGRTFDYAKGESIPIAEQGKFGAGTFDDPQGYATRAGFIAEGPQTRSFGGTGRPGGFVQAQTPESRLQRAREESAITRAAEPFPEVRQIEARAKADAGVRVATEQARDAFKRDKLRQEVDRQRQAEQMNREFEGQRAKAQRNVEAAEARAKATGNEEDIRRAAELREKFENEMAQAERYLDRSLAIKGVRSGYDRRQQ